MPDFVGMYIKFCGGLTLLFVILRLFQVIHWKLRWVFAPLWIPIVLVTVWIIVLELKDKFSG